MINFTAYTSRNVSVAVILFSFIAGYTICWKCHDLIKFVNELLGLSHKRKKILISSNIVEVCACDIDSFSQALEANVDSIEICSNLEAGGITPSLAFIKKCSSMLEVGKQLHVLVRPRAGDFTYNQLEYEIMLEDIDLAINAGATGDLIES